MLHQIFWGCLQIDLVFLLTQNLGSAAKSSTAEHAWFAHRLWSDVSMKANTCQYASRRGENSELTMDTDAWRYLPGADVQHREWTNMGRSFLSQWIGFWVSENSGCAHATCWLHAKNLLLSSFLNTKKKTHKSKVSNCYLLKHHLNNLLNFHHLLH